MVSNVGILFQMKSYWEVHCVRDEAGLPKVEAGQGAGKQGIQDIPTPTPTVPLEPPRVSLHSGRATEDGYTDCAPKNYRGHHSCEAEYLQGRVTKSLYLEQKLALLSRQVTLIKERRAGKGVWEWLRVPVPKYGK